MAVYRMTGGGAISGTDADLIGSPLLTGVPPTDFDPTRISQIAVEYSLAIVNHADDDWTENRKVTLTVGGVNVIDNAGLAAIPRSNGIFPFTYTETNPAAITAWSDPVLTAGDGTWVTYKKNKSNDGSTATITQTAVVVTYTPVVAVPPVASYIVTPPGAARGDVDVRAIQDIYAGQALVFTDTSTGRPTEWTWGWEGGTPASSTLQGPHTVTFDDPGTFTVTMSVANSAGSSSAPDQTVTVNPVAEVFNGSAWVGAEAWNGAAWVVPEIWNGAQWIPVKVP